MNLKTMTRDELLAEARKQAAIEKKATFELIECLREIDSRLTYLEMGYPSLHKFAIEYLGLSEGSAHRRIATARLIAEIPDLKPALEEGKLNLTTVVLAQSAFGRESYTVPEKKEILRELECHSRREVEQTLAALCPQKTKPAQVRALSGTHSELKGSISHEMLKKLDRLRELLAHTHSKADYFELLEYSLDLALKKLDPDQKKKLDPDQEKKLDPNQKDTPSVHPAPNTSTVKATKNIRYVSSPLKLLIWKRAKGSCEYVCPKTGRRCGSRFALQYDHIVPVARGGATTECNLRLLCASHNGFEAARVLGPQLMNRYRPGGRD